MCRQLRDTHAPGYLIAHKVALGPEVKSAADEVVSLNDFNASVPTFQTNKKKNVDLGFKGLALKTISERSKHLKLLFLCPNPQSPTWPLSCPNRANILSNSPI